MAYSVKEISRCGTRGESENVLHAGKETCKRGPTLVLKTQERRHRCVSSPRKSTDALHIFFKNYQIADPLQFWMSVRPGPRPHPCPSRLPCGRTIPPCRRADGRCRTSRG